MEEQIVSFETAKMLREIGFDIIQRFGSESSLYNKQGRHSYYCNYGFMYSGINEGRISAPTQALAQKWLREKHNLHIVPLGFANNYYWGYEIYFLDKLTIDFNLPIPKHGNTYEAALEAGLQEALKLIKEKTKR